MVRKSRSYLPIREACGAQGLFTGAAFTPGVGVGVALGSSRSTVLKPASLPPSVWSGHVPSDTGIYTPGIGLNLLIAVAGEVKVAILPSSKKQGGPPGISTFIFQNKGTGCVSVKTVPAEHIK